MTQVNEGDIAANGRLMEVRATKPSLLRAVPRFPGAGRLFVSPARPSDRKSLTVVFVHAALIER